jgi:hypothetical protein
MPTSATLSPAASTLLVPGCVRAAAVFQHPLVEEPPRAGAPRGERARYAELVAQAQGVCASCPLVRDCLYAAVVDHDVVGFVGGTTAQQRLEIRRRLGVVVEPEDLDTLAGVVGGHRPVDHDEVLRLRRANPDESLETLARRLGCSLSTVKRHLRRERRQPAARRPATRPLPGQVLQAAGTVLGAAGGVSRAA